MTRSVGMRGNRVHTSDRIGRYGGGLAMRDEWNHRGHRRKRRDRARWRRARSVRDEVEEFDDSTLTAEERAYRDARWLAERKVKVTGSAIDHIRQPKKINDTLQLK